MYTDQEISAEIIGESHGAGTTVSEEIETGSDEDEEDEEEFDEDHEERSDFSGADMYAEYKWVEEMEGFVISTENFTDVQTRECVGYCEGRLIEEAK